MQDPTVAFLQQIHTCHQQLHDLGRDFCVNRRFRGSGGHRWFSSLGITPDDEHFWAASSFRIDMPLDPDYRSTNEVSLIAGVRVKQDSYSAQMVVSASLAQAVEGLAAGDHFLYRNIVESASSQQAVDALPGLITGLGDLAELLAAFVLPWEPVVLPPYGTVQP